MSAGRVLLVLGALTGSLPSGAALSGPSRAVETAAMPAAVPIEIAPLVVPARVSPDRPAVYRVLTVRLTPAPGSDVTVCRRTPYITEALLLGLAEDPVALEDGAMPVERLDDRVRAIAGDVVGEGHLAATEVIDGMRPLGDSRPVRTCDDGSMGQIQ